MRKFSYISRIYPMSGGDYVSKSEPGSTKQANGFKPTFLTPNGSVSQGEPIEISDLNYLFGSLYEMADGIDENLKKIRELNHGIN